MDDSKLRGKAKELARARSNSSVHLSPLLSEVYYKRSYAAWGYETFGEYAEQELDMKYRTAMQLAAIGEMIGKYRLTMRLACKIGSTKLGLIERVVDSRNVRRVLKAGLNMSVADLKSYLGQKRKIHRVGKVVYIAERTDKRILSDRVMAALASMVEFRQLDGDTQLEIASETATLIKMPEDDEKEHKVNG
jgi:hypothetical protein